MIDFSKMCSKSKYIYIKDLKIGDKITQVFLVAHIDGSRITKTGKPYARLQLKDRYGDIPVNVWGFNSKKNPELKAGVYIQAELEVQDYKGTKNGVMCGLPMIVPTPADLSPYENHLGLSSKESDSFYDYLMGVKDEVMDPLIKAYLDVIFDNAETKRLFKIAPASASNRGAYRGGLVEHVAKVMHNAEAIVESQKWAHSPAPLNKDIVIAGVLVHDLGKMYAYTVDITGAKHTRSGRLLQHLPISYSLSIQAFIQTESVLGKPIPEETKDHINHCILAHHGQLEFGSPVKPQSLEAQIVHMADMADSTVSCFAEPARDNQTMIDSDGFVEGTWLSSKHIYIGNKQSPDTP